MSSFPLPSPAGTGTELNTVDATVVVKIGPKQSDSRYELFEVYASRGTVSPLHREPWAKAFYVLHGRMAMQVDTETYDLGPGSSISVPAGAANTFTALTPSVTFLALSLTDAMGRFFADLDQTVPAGQPLEHVVPYVLEVTERHGVTFAAPTLPGAVP
jgi:quercetin dioxygenase-like cupin family protein